MIMHVASIRKRNMKKAGMYEDGIRVACGKRMQMDDTSVSGFAVEGKSGRAMATNRKLDVLLCFIRSCNRLS